MTAQQVLIVDDSKMAQVRLRKLLDKYAVTVDAVGSAEEGLGYLSYKRPDVIFLDHHMEGMDGLEALKIIKSNPDTALIPVIMYTSEQGDVYVGQARALGALDIISKDVIKPSNLQKLLSSLNIRPRGEESEVKKDVQASAVVEPPKLSVVQDTQYYAPSSNYESDVRESERLSLRISQMLELHISKVRQEMEDNTRLILRRLSKDAEPKAATEESANDEAVIDDDYLEQKSSGNPATVIFVLLVTGMLVTGFYLFLSHKQLNQLTDRYAILTEQVKDQNQQLINLVAAIENQPEVSGSSFEKRIMFDALSWAANVDTKIPFGELALGDERIYMLGELLSLLGTANFEGTVFLDIHAGNYCVVEGASGEFLLPDAQSSLADCFLVSERVLEPNLDDEVSVGFINYINSTPILQDGKIQLELDAIGYTSPKFSYPARTNAVTAGEWNSVAQKNHRLGFSFAPDE